MKTKKIIKNQENKKQCSKCNLLLDIDENKYGKYGWCNNHTCKNYHNIIVIEDKNKTCPNPFCDGMMKITHLLSHKCNKCGLEK